ncbi:uncharacterized protein LOC120356065 [Nilaparvata lugens]|nr:uncharacterized protein LOC120356065 [Nilaparvata lugens]
MTLLQQEEDEILPEEHFLTVINRYAPKPWTPLRELMEGTPYPIEDVREVCNQHGRRVVLKIRLSGQRTTDVYIPERFTQILTSKDIQNFKSKCKSLLLFVKHINQYMTDINIVKMHKI